MNSNEFICGICRDIASNVVETSCCHNIFCKKCLEIVKKSKNSLCPQCRNAFEIIDSQYLRRVIEKLKVKCPAIGCGITLDRGELSDHQKKCSFKNFQCPAYRCSYSGAKTDFVQHLSTEHVDILVENAARLFIEPRIQQNKQNWPYETAGEFHSEYGLFDSYTDYELFDEYEDYGV